MSLSPLVVTYALGILAAKDFDNPQMLDDLLGAKLKSIAHLYTNGANPLVTQFALENGLSYTVFPINAGRGLPLSTRQVVEASEVVLIIATPKSHSTKQIANECNERSDKDPAFKWRTIEYEPVTYWREKVGRVAEFIGNMDKDEIEANPWTQDVQKIIQKIK